jgi:ATP-dependent DNA helicase RecG
VPIDVATIGEDQVKRVLAYEEGHFLDLKAIEVKPATLTRTISAFANADGGELFVGIDEDKAARSRTWRGFVTQEEANGHLQIFEELFPLAQDFDYEFLRRENDVGGGVSSHHDPQDPRHQVCKQRPTICPAREPEPTRRHARGT